MDSETITKRLNLAIEKPDGPWECRYKSASYSGPIIRLRTTTHYHYFGWGVYHLRDNDISRVSASFALNGVFELLRDCHKKSKERCPKLRAMGDEMSGSWLWCDNRTSEELVDILEAHYLQVLPK